ncbi:ABC transporter ATP-binding protein [Lactonifactor longoviformis]|uniref:Putative ABC transport system ATP-binding protein n=1 Tax=Lactonifactor longoviformis DSM 17459 TaxID=1122155 RepID=A0A1M4YG48_9CLOT|nr:ABC transporter ATP-binding protein [Lactonifactor longoviformis]POP31708.1 ABC transporter ATP-binding protein [Lactonifactor longoviformis]SHF04492.1 putative ABC transport system ATP-binding protein [Lactonifactor longoviformis DSM 17459]
MEILRCSHLTKTYGSGSNKVTALNDISLSLEKGSFTAIVGTSGSGKSTLLHMLGGVDRPTGGNIYIEDTDISTLSMEQLAVFRRRKVGLVYQFYNLIPTLNVQKNILLPVLLDGQKPDMNRFHQITGALGLSDRLSHLPRELSGGQQQRTAIARSLIYQPAILLADEPTGNLDRKNSEETIELLKLSNREYGQTVLLITHDEKTALEADRIITLEDGRLLHDEAVAL